MDTTLQATDDYRLPQPTPRKLWSTQAREQQRYADQTFTLRFNSPLRLYLAFYRTVACAVACRYL